mgnify:CR=1 FL=1
MTATEIRDEIARRGGRLEVQADRLLVRPGRVLDDPLREAVRAHKADLLALASTSWDWLVFMPADRFRAGRYLVRLRSEILGEEIALVSTPALLPRAKALGLVAYLPDEIDALAAHPLTPDTLRKTHATKKAMLGRITGSTGGPPE